MDEVFALEVRISKGEFGQELKESIYDYLHALFAPTPEEMSGASHYDNDDDDDQVGKHLSFTDKDKDNEV